MSTILAVGARAASKPLLEAAARPVAVAGLHTSPTSQKVGMEKVDWSSKRWQMPTRLEGIPTEQSPNFFNMVEYYFHKGGDLRPNHCFPWNAKFKLVDFIFPLFP